VHIITAMQMITPLLDDVETSLTFGVRAKIDF
jgi:hypothetical protein